MTAWLAWSPARVATPAATSTSVRASSIARIRPAAVCAASRIATADCSAAAATSLVLPSIPRADAGGRAGALGQRLGLFGAGADQVGDAALELLALAAALVGRLDRLEQRDLRQDDVGLDDVNAVKGGDAVRELVAIAVKLLGQCGEDAVRDVARSAIYSGTEVLSR